MSDLPTIVRKGTLTHQEAAVYLGISERQLDTWVQLEGVPVAMPSGERGKRLYSRRLLDRWVEDRSQIRTGSSKKSATKSGKVIGLPSAEV